jgi:hypothetical protein
MKDGRKRTGEEANQKRNLFLLILYPLPIVVQVATVAMPHLTAIF